MTKNVNHQNPVELTTSQRSKQNIFFNRLCKKIFKRIFLSLTNTTKIPNMSKMMRKFIGNAALVTLISVNLGRGGGLGSLWATEIDLTNLEISSATSIDIGQNVGVLIGNYGGYVYKSANVPLGSSYTQISDSFKLDAAGISISNSSDAFLAGILTNDSTLQFDFTTQSITVVNNSTDTAGAQVAGFAYTSDTEFGGKIRATGAGNSTYSVTGNGNAYGFIFTTNNMSGPVGLSGATINLANTTINVTKDDNVTLGGIDSAYGFLAGNLTGSTVQLGDISVENQTTNTNGIYTYGFSAGNVGSGSTITLNDVSSTGIGNFLTGVHLGDINGTVDIGNITATNTNASIKSQVYGFTAGEINKNVTIGSINVNNVSTDNGATTYGFNSISITSDATVNVGDIKIGNSTANTAIGFFVNNDTVVPSIEGEVTFNNITVKNSSNNYFVSGISLGQFTNDNVNLGAAGEQAIILNGNIDVEGNGYVLGIHAGRLDELNVSNSISAKTNSSNSSHYVYGIHTCGFTAKANFSNPTEYSVINILDDASIYATANTGVEAASIRMDSTDNDVVNIVAGNSVDAWTNDSNAFTLVGVETLNVNRDTTLTTGSKRGTATTSTTVAAETYVDTNKTLTVESPFFNGGIQKKTGEGTITVNGGFNPSTGNYTSDAGYFSKLEIAKGVFELTGSDASRGILVVTNTTDKDAIKIGEGATFRIAKGDAEDDNPVAIVTPYQYDNYGLDGTPTQDYDPINDTSNRVNITVDGGTIEFERRVYLSGIDSYITDNGATVKIDGDGDDFTQNAGNIKEASGNSNDGFEFTVIVDGENSQFQVNEHDFLLPNGTLEIAKGHVQFRNFYKNNVPSNPNIVKVKKIVVGTGEEDSIALFENYNISAIIATEGLTINEGSTALLDVCSTITTNTAWNTSSSSTNHEYNIPVSINNGTIKFYNSTPTDRTVNFKGTTTITGNATFNVDTQGPVPSQPDIRFTIGEVTASDSNAANLTKTGAGTLIIQKTFDLNSGTIDVQAGTLEINPDTSNADLSLDANVQLNANKLIIGNDTNSIAQSVTIGSLTGNDGSTTNIHAKDSLIVAKDSIYSGQLTATTATVTDTAKLIIGNGTNAADVTLNHNTPFTGATNLNVEIAANSQLTLSRPTQTGDYAFNQKLTGTGTLETTLKETADKFSLGNTVGNAFAGTVSLAKGTIELDGVNNANDESLASATLKLSTTSVAEVKSDTEIKNLTTNGGTVKFTTTEISPNTTLTVDNLDVNGNLTLDLADNITAAINTTSLGTQNFYDYSNDSSNYQQQLIAASSVSGNAGNITLNPVAVDSKQSRTINNGTEDVGTATFDYNASVATDGVYLGYGLTEIQADNGKTVTLDATNSATPSLYAKLTGTGGFKFTGSSNQEATVGNSNSSYTGAAEVTGTNFTVNAATNNAFGQTSLLKVTDATAKVDFNGNSQTVGGLAGQGEITNTNNTMESTLTVHSTADSTFDGTITGTTALTKDGSQNLTLSGNNTYSGATTISEGTLALTGTGSIADSSKVTVNGKFDISGVTASSASVKVLEGSGSVYLGNTHLKVGSGNFGGVISNDDAGLIKTYSTDNNNTLILSEEQNYIGKTTIESGTIKLVDDGDISKSSGVELVNSGTAFDISEITDKTSIKSLTGVTNTIVKLGSKELEVANGDFAGAIEGNGTLTKIDSETSDNTLKLTGTNNSFTGVTNIENGTLELSGSIEKTSEINVASNATLDIKGVKTLNNLDSQGTVTFDNALTLAGDADTTISGLAGTAAANVTKTGTGTTTLGDNQADNFVQKKGEVVLAGTLTGNYTQETTAGNFVADAGTGHTATIIGDAQFNATVELESQLHIEQNLNLESTSTVNVDLANFNNLTANEVIVTVDGIADIDVGAKLNIVNWEPGTGESTFQLLSANSITGTFDVDDVTFEGSNPNNRQGVKVENFNFKTFTNNLAITRDNGGTWSDSPWGVSDDNKFYNGDYVTFNGSGTQELAVNVNNNVETAGIKIEAGNWSFSGNKITGKVQTGDSAETLINNNDGKLTVNGNKTIAAFNNALDVTGISVTDRSELKLLGNETVKTGTLETDTKATLTLQAADGKIQASNNVILNGDVQFNYDPGNTAAGDVNVITTTNGTISGNFVNNISADSSISDKLLLSAQAKLVDNKTKLNITYIASSISDFAASNGLSGNFVQIGDLIDAQDASNHLLQQLYGLGKDEQEKFEQVLFEQLGPELAADAMQLSLWQPYVRVFNRLHETDNIYGNDILGQCGYLNYELWFEGYYRSENVSRDAFANGYKISRGGLLTGIESRLDQSIRAGLFFGYGNPRVSNNLGRIEADDITFGAYSRLKLGQQLCLNTFLAYGSQEYKYRRDNFTNYNGETLYASIELFQTALRKNNLKLIPLLAVDFQKAWTDGFTTADTNQKIDKNSLDQTVLRIGLNSTFQPTELLHFRTRLQYGVQISGDLYGSARTSFLAKPTESRVLNGVNLGRNMFNVGIGTEIYITNAKRAKLFADYDLDLGERSTAHTAQFGFITNW